MKPTRTLLSTILFAVFAALSFCAPATAGDAPALLSMSDFQAPGLYALHDVGPKGDFATNAQSFDAATKSIGATSHSQPVLLMQTAGYIGRVHPLYAFQTIGRPIEGHRLHSHWRTYNI